VQPDGLALPNERDRTQGPFAVGSGLPSSNLYKALEEAGRSHRSCDSLPGKRGVMVETRKLAAILAADVVGYSKLAGADEDRTLARLRALRSDLIEPTIAVHSGRVVKRTGDGLIVEFRSVVDAVRLRASALAHLGASKR